MASTAILPDSGYDGEHDGLESLAEQITTGVRADLVDDRLIWPSIPSVALTIRKLMRHPDATPTEVAHVVSMDPVISARLLRMANDKTYGFACDCASLELALQRLGGRAAEQVDELFVAGQIYNVGNRRRIQSHLGRLWRHSTQVASICRHLAPGCALEPGIAMVAGLLHDYRRSAGAGIC